MPAGASYRSNDDGRLQLPMLGFDRLAAGAAGADEEADLSCSTAASFSFPTSFPPSPHTDNSSSSIITNYPHTYASSYNAPPAGGTHGPSSNSNDVSPTKHDQLVMRRQPSRPKAGGGAKRFPSSRARFVNLANHAILDDLEFSGWGTSIELTEDELLASDTSPNGESTTTIAPRTIHTDVFGTWKATGIAGSAVLGSVCYAFPAVVHVAGIWSPLSLLLACAIFFLLRP